MSAVVAAAPKIFWKTVFHTQIFSTLIFFGNFFFDTVNEICFSVSEQNYVVKDHEELLSNKRLMVW